MHRLKGALSHKLERLGPGIHCGKEVLRERNTLSHEKIAVGSSVRCVREAKDGREVVPGNGNRLAGQIHPACVCCSQREKKSCCGLP